MDFTRCYGCMGELDAPGAVCPQCGFDNTNDPAKQPSHVLPCGTILNGQYMVGRSLGQGGFGITYIGYDLNLEIPVCIKEYYPEGAASRSATQSRMVYWGTSENAQGMKENRRSFVKEAQKAVKLRNLAHVVTVWGVFYENETAYIVMDYIEGETLKNRLVRTQKTLGERECVELLTPVMEDLEKAHARGIVHRDIKPENIMLGADGEPTLLDMGAAKDLGKTAQNGSTLSSNLVVSQGFSPLEQYRQHAEIGAWTDVYAMCATMYYCVTGRVLPPPIERLVEDRLDMDAFSPDFAQALQRGLAIRPEDRTRSMAELLASLDAALGSGGAGQAEEKPAPEKRPTPPPEPAARPEPEKRPTPKSEPAARPEPEKRPTPPPEPVTAPPVIPVNAGRGGKKLAPALVGTALALIIASGSLWFLNSGRSNAVPAPSPTASGTKEPSSANVWPPPTEKALSTGTTRTGLSYDVLADSVRITGCDKSVQDVIIPAEIEGKPVTAIAGSAFWACTSMTSVTIPDSVTSIDSQAFFWCTALTSVTIPDSVTSIGVSAFGICESLKSVLIPTGVSEIPEKAFGACKSLTDVYYNGTREQWEKIVIGKGNESLTGAAIHCANLRVDEQGYSNGTEEYANGDVYEGEFINGLKDGWGTMTYAEDDENNRLKFEGWWKNDQIEGYGTCTWANGEVYEGDWKNGLRDGWGTMQYINGDVYDGEWKNGIRGEGQGTMKYAGGDVYMGDWKNGLRDGWGSMEYTNGNVYEGDWKNDQIEGYGICTWANGDVYGGDWKNGLRDGKGNCTWADGTDYVGDWKNDQRNGQGTMTYADGSYYDGDWKNDQRNGQGTMNYADGSYYDGEWKNDQRNGQGTMTYYPDYRMETGAWKDDIFVG